VVALFVGVPSRILVALFRFLTDYEAIKVVGMSSVISIPVGFWKLPPLAKPASGSAQGPYVRARRKRGVLVGIGVITVVVTLVTLWLHSLVPAEIGHVIKPPIEVELFRAQLEKFLASFALLIMCQAAYWILWSAISRNKP